MFGCSFVSNTQGVVGGTSVAAASNFGGGALAISQGSVSIRGSSPGNLCQFISNSLQAGLPALASPVPGGGSAIRVTALNADGTALCSLEWVSLSSTGDSAPLIQFDVQQCSFVSNNGQVAGMLSAAVVFLGTGATEVSDMPVKPSLQSVLWFENTAIAGSASGLYYGASGYCRFLFSFLWGSHWSMQMWLTPLAPTCAPPSCLILCSHRRRHRQCTICK